MKKLRIVSCYHCPQSLYLNSLDIRICNDPWIAKSKLDFKYRQCPSNDVRADCPLENCDE